jgi:hypothetical protein
LLYFNSEKYTRFKILKNPLQALFDPGSNETFLHSRCFPPGIIPSITTMKTAGRAMAGQVISSQAIILQDIILPEFSKHHFVDEHNSQLFNADCYYDTIIGRDFL